MLNQPKDSRIVICGTARNIENRIEAFVETFSKSFADFVEIQFLILESFSTDDTVNNLKAYQAKHSNFRFEQDKNISENEIRRTVRIASARSELQRIVREEYQDFDFVVMADMDGVNSNLTKRGVLSCWKWADWDVMTANQPLRYYDIWALRARNWSETDCWQEFEGLRNLLGDRKARHIAVTSKMKIIPTFRSPIKVESAFGGLAIYTRSAFLSGLYKGANNSGGEVCEHVEFHRTISSKGFNIFINPAMVNISPLKQMMTITKENIAKLFGFTP